MAVHLTTIFSVCQNERYMCEKVQTIKNHENGNTVSFSQWWKALNYKEDFHDLLIKIKIEFFEFDSQKYQQLKLPKIPCFRAYIYDLSSSSFELLKVPWFIEWIWPILKMSIAFEAIWICTKVDQGFCLPGFSQNMYVCIPKSVNYSKLHKEELWTLSLISSLEI